MAKKVCSNYGCDFEGSKKEMNKHKVNCPKRLLPCRFCKKKQKADELERHQTDCPKREVCPWCSHEFNKKQTKAHLAKCHKREKCLWCGHRETPFSALQKHEKKCLKKPQAMRTALKGIVAVLFMIMILIPFWYQFAPPGGQRLINATLHVASKIPSAILSRINYRSPINEVIGEILTSDEFKAAIKGKDGTSVELAEVIAGVLASPEFTALRPADGEDGTSVELAEVIAGVLASNEFKAPPATEGHNYLTTELKVFTGQDIAIGVSTTKFTINNPTQTGNVAQAWVAATGWHFAVYKSDFSEFWLVNNSDPKDGVLVYQDGQASNDAANALADAGEKTTELDLSGQ